MYFYNVKQNSKTIYHHILDPDYFYNIPTEKELLHPYFKNLIIPNEVSLMVGIYMEYEIQNIDVKMYPQLYQKCSSYIEKRIQKHLDFGCANLFNSNSHYFFLTMFNIDQKEVIDAVVRLRKDIIQLKSPTDKKIKFQLRCGLYFSHPFIHPYDFFDACKEQFENTILNEKSFISCKPYLEPL